MKFLNLIAVVSVTLTVSITTPARAEVDLVTELREAMLTERVPRLEERITSATPEHRKALLAAIVRIHQEAMDGAVRHEGPDGSRVWVAAQLLRTASDDDSTLAAFRGSLNRIGGHDGEIHDEFAIDALSKCLDPRAVEIMAAFARIRLKEMKELVSKLSPAASDDVRRAANVKTSDFMSALIGLARSANSSGKAVARQLREEVVKDEGKLPYGARFLERLAIELDPLLKDVPQPALPRRGTPVAAQATKPKQLQQSKPEKPQTVTAIEQKQSSSSGTMLISGVLAALALLGVLIWFLRKK